LNDLYARLSNLPGNSEEDERKLYAILALPGTGRAGYGDLLCVERELDDLEAETVELEATVKVLELQLRTERHSLSIPEEPVAPRPTVAAQARFEEICLLRLLEEELNSVVYVETAAIPPTRKKTSLFVEPVIRWITDSIPSAILLSSGRQVYVPRPPELETVAHLVLALGVVGNRDRGAPQSELESGLQNLLTKSIISLVGAHAGDPRVNRWVEELWSTVDRLRWVIGAIGSDSVGPEVVDADIYPADVLQ